MGAVIALLFLAQIGFGTVSSDAGGVTGVDSDIDEEGNSTFTVGQSKNAQAFGMNVHFKKAEGL